MDGVWKHSMGIVARPAAGHCPAEVKELFALILSIKADRGKEFYDLSTQLRRVFSPLDNCVLGKPLFRCNVRCIEHEIDANYVA